MDIDEIIYHMNEAMDNDSAAYDGGSSRVEETMLDLAQRLSGLNRGELRSRLRVGDLSEDFESPEPVKTTDIL